MRYTDMNKAVKIFLMLFLVFTTVIGTGMYFYLKEDINQAVGQQKEPPIDLDESDYKERVNILLLGVDTLTTDKDQQGTRSDTIMILSVDPAEKTGFMLSIPRDSYVKISGRNTYSKINHAHSWGGTDLALATIKDFVGIPIHHYVKVDYQALFKTVDDLGGVEFDVPIDMYHTDKRSEPPLYINLKKGVQLLDGDKAMQLVRNRSGYDDWGRVEVQRNFIKEVLKKMYAPSSIMKIPKFIGTWYDYVETDMTLGNMLSLMKIGKDLDLDKIEMATAPGAGKRIDGAGDVVIIDEAAFREQLDYLLAGVYETEIETPEEAPAEVNQ